MSIVNEKEYYVVAFPANEEEELSVELVPTSWVYPVGVDWKCYYPPPKDYSKISKWVKRKISPRLNWKSFTVNIIADASKYFFYN